MAETKTPVGYQQLTVSSAAVGLTLPAASNNVTGPRYAVIRCATANVRWRDDGTNPSATVGVPLNVGEILEYDGNLSAIKFIRVSADATLDISYYA